MTHPDTPVAELMTPQPVALAPSDSLAQARFLLERYPFRHLPVVEGGKVVAYRARVSLSFKYAP